MGSKLCALNKKKKNWYLLSAKRLSTVEGADEHLALSSRSSELPSCSQLRDAVHMQICILMSGYNNYINHLIHYLN